MANKVKVTALALAIAPGLNTLYVNAAPNDNVYVPGGVALNLSPGNILDPNGVGVTGPSQVGPVLPAVYSEYLDGYYAQVAPTTGGNGTAGLAAYKLQYFAPGGAEIAAGAYPAAVTAGTLVLAIPYSA